LLDATGDACASLEGAAAPVGCRLQAEWNSIVTRSGEWWT